MTKSTKNNQGCLTAILQAVGIKLKSKPVERLPYRVQKSILTPAEISFYHVLESLVASKFTICPKMRLADIFSINTKENYFTFFNKISQRHIDFLICQPKTMQPVLGIELDDGSHKRKNRQERDKFVNEAFKSANFPLVRIPAQRSYSTKALMSRLQRYLPELASERVEKESNNQESKSNLEGSASIPKCPKCGSGMVVRTVKKGEHKGKQFYGCPTFPKCRGVLPINESAALASK